MEITILVNGAERRTEDGITVGRFLERLGVRRQTAVVEHNRRILKKDDYDSVTLKERDELELVRFVGGG
ncbi:MAG: sulfur carrier protein ThiS [bacterium]